MLTHDGMGILKTLVTPLDHVLRALQVFILRAMTRVPPTKVAGPTCR